MLTIKRFFAYSIALHTLFIIAALLFVPPSKGKREEEFFARLISPEELLARAPHISSLSEVRPAFPVKPKASISPPLVERSVPKAERSVSKMPEQGVSVSKHSSSTAPTSHGTESRPGNARGVKKSGLPVPSVREKIFDKTVIGDIAKRETEKEGGERTFTFNVKEMRYLGYLQRLKERIESIWIYPYDAATRGIYGDLIIKFTIKKNGELGEVELMRTSGFKSLDDAALRALRDAEPFWPLPDEWGMETYTIMGQFIYTIYGYYIR